jgi:hypothetical protein
VPGLVPGWPLFAAPFVADADMHVSEGLTAGDGTKNLPRYVNGRFARLGIDGEHAQRIVVEAQRWFLGGLGIQVAAAAWTQPGVPSIESPSVEQDLPRRIRSGTPGHPQQGTGDHRNQHFAQKETHGIGKGYMRDPAGQQCAAVREKLRIRPVKVPQASGRPISWNRVGPDGLVQRGAQNSGLLTHLRNQNTLVPKCLNLHQPFGRQSVPPHFQTLLRHDAKSGVLRLVETKRPER